MTCTELELVACCMIEYCCRNWLEIFLALPFGRHLLNFLTASRHFSKLLHKPAFPQPTQNCLSAFSLLLCYTQGSCGVRSLPIDTHPKPNCQCQQCDNMRVIVGEKDENEKDEEETVKGKIHDSLRDGVVFGCEDRVKETFPEGHWGSIGGACGRCRSRHCVEGSGKLW